MPWFRVDDGFANSRPVLKIPRRYRAAAVGLWTLAGTWAAKELTDGFVPGYILDDLASTPAMAGQLVRSGLWTQTVKDDVEGWQFVNWTEYNPTKIEVLARREAEAEKKRVAREAKRQADEQRKRNLSRGDSLGDGGGSPGHIPEGVRSTRPVPTRPVPTSSLVETSQGAVTSADVRETPRPPKCPDHETNSETPCHKCRATREWERDNAFAVQRNELENRRRAKARRENCPVCHGTNWIPDTDPAVKCNHQEANHA